MTRRKLCSQACAWVKLQIMSYLFGSKTVRLIAIALGLSASLAGCYVVPIQSMPVQNTPAGAVSGSPSAPVTIAARLYPSNEAASGYGVIQAVVTNDMHGRGVFSTTINGESFSGEATRKAGSSREGMASGAGSRGSYISCEYQMNSATLGMGKCKLSNGAEFTMHVGG